MSREPVSAGLGTAVGPSEPTLRDHGLTRRRLLGRALSAGGTLAFAGGASSLLAACGGGSGGADGAAVSAADVHKASGVIHMLGWQYYNQPAENDGPVKAKWSYITSGPEIATKIRPVGAYDVFNSTAYQMGQFLAEKRLMPIETELLTNYRHLTPILRDNTTWKGPDGKVYGLPIEYSAVYTPYLPAKVPEPTTAQDLLAPAFRNAIGLTDDPQQTIPQIARVLGKQGDPARITEQEFEGVKAYLHRLRPQVRTIYNTGEEPSLLERGDISLALTSYAYVVVSGVKGLKTTFFGSLAYSDGLSILKGGDVPAAHSWIDHVLSLKAQRQLAAKGPFQPARLEASSALPSALQDPPFSQLVKVSPLMTRPPLKSEPGVASLADWSSAWNDYKASFG